MYRPGKKETKKMSFYIYLNRNPWVFRALDELGQQEDRSHNYLVNQAVVEFLKNRGFGPKGTSGK